MNITTQEIVAFTLLLVGLFVLAVYFRRHDQKYLKKKTSETFSDSLREEIEKEREENKRKQSLFEEAMRKAQK